MVAQKFPAPQKPNPFELLQKNMNSDADALLEYSKPNPLSWQESSYNVQSIKNGSTFYSPQVRIEAKLENKNTKILPDLKQKISDPIFVILMKEDKNRKKHVDRIKHKFNALNISIWTALTPRDMLTGKFSSYYNKKTVSKVREGAIACALSHLTLLQWFVTTSMENIIVLEDDAELDENFVNMYNMFREQLPDDFEFSQLFHHKQMDKKRKNKKFLIPRRNLVMKAYGSYGTVGYLVSRKGAEKILKHAIPIYTTMDDMYMDMIANSILISYMPTSDLITMPYKFKSNIWKTKTNSNLIKDNDQEKRNTQCKAFAFRRSELFDELNSLLNFTHHLLQSLHIRYAVTGGTLLGVMRHGNIIPWDDDLDLLLAEKGSQQKIISYLSHNDLYCTATFWGGMKLFKCNAQKIQGFQWKYPFVDIFDPGSDIKNHMRRTITEGLLLPETLVKLGPIHVYAPVQAEQYLNAYFGGEEWKNKCVSPGYNHAKEWALKSYSMPCIDIQSMCGPLWPTEFSLKADKYLTNVAAVQIGQEQNGWKKSIDIVIPWSGFANSSSAEYSFARDAYNGELSYLLRSIDLNAAWVNKIFVFVNGNNAQQTNLVIPDRLLSKVHFVDRCLHMPVGTCPTRNSFAVTAYIHRIPDLSEHFVIVHDDIFLGRPISELDLFDQKGRPYVWRKEATWGHFARKGFHEIYIDMSVADFPTPQSSAPSPHFWWPQLKSVCASMEKEYHAFYLFVASHRTGRYSSLDRGVNEKRNSQEECPLGWMNWKYLTSGTGAFKSIDNARGKLWEEVAASKEGFNNAVKKRPMFMNVNVFSKDPALYRKQMTWLKDAMQALFPLHTTRDTVKAVSLNDDTDINTTSIPVIVAIHFNTPLPDVVTFYKQLNLCRAFDCYYISSWGNSYRQKHSSDTNLFQCDANVDMVYGRNGHQMHECYALFLDYIQQETDILFIHDDVILTQSLSSIIKNFRSAGPYPRVPRRIDIDASSEIKAIDVYNRKTWSKGTWGLESKWNYGKKLQRALSAMQNFNLKHIDCNLPPQTCFVRSVNGDVLWVPHNAKRQVSKLFHYFHKYEVGYAYAIGITLALLSAGQPLLPSFKLLWGSSRANAFASLREEKDSAFFHPVKISKLNQKEQLQLRAFYDTVSSPVASNAANVFSNTEKNNQEQSHSVSAQSSATGKLFSGEKIREYDHGISLPSPNKLKANTSSATGKLFLGERIRNYFEAISQARHRNLLSLDVKSKCSSKNWAVLTTINAETEAVRKAANLSGWCVVVVGDEIGPKSYPIRDNVIFLDVDSQRLMEQSNAFVAQIPWGHFGRKNVGYLYAVLQGADLIFDFDDDNELIKNPLQMTQMTTTCSPDDSFLTFNPYPELLPSAAAPWPRGLPLEEYHNKATIRKCSETVTALKGAIYQSAANHDPDVDAVYRLTREIPFTFQDGNKAIIVPPNVFVPYNAQANIHTRASMWALMLPTTVEGRVSDIWRGYISQRLLWDQGFGVVYTSPVVQQIRNKHNYLADLEAEQDLYHRSGVLLRFLKSWTCKSKLPKCIQALWIDLYERGYIEVLDVQLIHAWITELESAGYVFEHAT